MGADTYAVDEDAHRVDAEAEVERSLNRIYKPQKYTRNETQLIPGKSVILYTFLGSRKI